MTQVVTVHTDFTDLNQMAQGLVGRVNDTHVILPGPDPVDVGDWVQFAVTLFDGTPGFAGVGRCVTVVDNGEERMSHQRFDVVIDSLQFDSRGQQVFEHILTLNGGAEYGEEEPAAEASADESEAPAEEEEAPFEDVSADFSNSRIELPADDLDEAEDEATMIGDSMAFAAAHHAAETAQTRPPPQPLPVDMDDEDDEDFEIPVAAPRSFGEPATGARASIPAAPAPVAAAPAPAARQTNGAANFSYPGGLPFPAKPPRPELDPSLKVSPAPRPRPGHH